MELVQLHPQSIRNSLSYNNNTQTPTHSSFIMNYPISCQAIQQLKIKLRR